jgi:hypothetical protein
MEKCVGGGGVRSRSSTGEDPQDDIIDNRRRFCLGIVDVRGLLTLLPLLLHSRVGK